MASGDWDVLTVKAQGEEFQVKVVDRVFPDRTCGQVEGGAIAVDHCGTEYFISDSGEVWLQPVNIAIGIAPTVCAESRRIELQMAGYSDHGIPFGYERDMALD